MNIKEIDELIKENVEEITKINAKKRKYGNLANISEKNLRKIEEIVKYAKKDSSIITRQKDFDMETVNAVSELGKSELKTLYALKEREEFLGTLNKELQSAKSSFESIAKDVEKMKENLSRLVNRKDISEQKARIHEKTKELNKIKKDISKTSQGKLKNIGSSLIGQIDKRVHNILYSDNKLGNALWKMKESVVNYRYEESLKYFAYEFGGKTALITVAALLGFFSPLVVGAAAVGFFTRLGATIYNNVKYGGKPELERHKIIQKGSFLENIKNSLFKRNRARKAISGTKSVNLSKIKQDVVTEEIVEHDDEEEKNNENVAKVVKELADAKLEDKSLENIQKLESLYVKGKSLENSLPFAARIQLRNIHHILETIALEKTATKPVNTVEKLNEKLGNLSYERIDTLTLNEVEGIIDAIRKYSNQLNDNAKSKYEHLLLRRSELIKEVELFAEKKEKYRQDAIELYMQLHPEISRDEAIKKADKFDEEGFTYEQQCERWNRELTNNKPVDKSDDNIPVVTPEPLKEEASVQNKKPQHRNNPSPKNVNKDFINRVDKLKENDFKGIVAVINEFLTMSEAKQRTLPKKTRIKLSQLSSALGSLNLNNKQTTRKTRVKNVSLNAGVGTDLSDNISSAYGDVGSYNPSDTERYWEQEETGSKKR